MTYADYTNMLARHSNLRSGSLYAYLVEEEIVFNKKLIEDGVLFKRQGSTANNAYQSHINAGFFVERFNEYGSQTLVTPKGILYIAKKYKKYIEDNSK